jgi:endoglucanase
LLRHRAGDQTETVYYSDLSGEDVYELDFSNLTTPGDYYLSIPGCGRSLPFRIGDQVYREPFDVSMNGLYHQRCGTELKTPAAHCYRPACHRSRTELTDLPRGSEANAFAELPRHVTSPVKHDIPGGYHDAGDFDPRTHIEIAETLLLLADMSPGALGFDLQRKPGERSTLPVALEAAGWEIDLWRRLQEPNGAVRGGIEEEGDPDQVTLAEEDPLREFAFAPDPRASLRFAGVAARAAILWHRFGLAAESADLAERAQRAWTWVKTPGLQCSADDIVRAAVQLYALTGDPSYREAFEKHSVFAVPGSTPPEQFLKYDQRDASFYYARCNRPIDAAIRRRIVESFRAMADDWLQAASTTAYRYARSPYAPNSWGTGGLPIWTVPLTQAFLLTGNRSYRHWIALTADFSLGCNPMNRVFTTRLGQRPIWRPLHLLSRYCPDAPIAGLQCQGPGPRTGGQPAGSSMSGWIDHGLYPTGPWPELQTYCDLGMVPDMNEGTVLNQVLTAFAYGFLLPDNPRDTHR